MSDQVLYRKYRSASFAQVIGQDHVVRTLSTAIAAGRIAHAYLFTGPRGTGKTSVARLLARAANCTGESKPCGQCQMCQTALNASLDIIEIDAASNRSIESIRELRDKVSLAPSIGSKKVYIIDEVHMLTNEAFNALLKTLEEPPAHVIFILATTEAHKVPETIVSRTQRMNFRPITEPDIVKHLAYIANNEAIPIEPAALESIALASRGGFRDAISMLDQLRSAGAGAITSATVRDVLGYAGQTELLELAEAIAEHNPVAALEHVSRLYTAGAAPAQTATGLAEVWRRVMRAASGAQDGGNLPASLLATGPHQAAGFVEAFIDVSRSAWPELALEAAVVKLTTTGGSTSTTPAPAVAPAAATAHTDTPKPASSKPAKPVAPTPEEAAAEPAVSAAESAVSNLTPELWPKVIVVVKSKNNSLAALLQMYQTDFAADEITIRSRFNFHRDLFLKSINRTLIEAAASKVYGRPVKIFAKVDDDPATARRKKAKPSAEAELVSSALEILGGEVVD